MSAPFNASNVCTSDSDCPGNLICFTSASKWFNASAYSPPAAYASLDVPVGCLCSDYYGWDGPDCTNFEWSEVGGPLVLFCLLLLTYFTLCVVAAMDIVRLLKAKRVFKSSVMIALVQVFAGTFCLVIEYIASIIVFSIPNQAPLLNSNGQKSTYPSAVAVYAFMFGGVLISCAMCSLAYGWIALAIKTQHFKMHAKSLEYSSRGLVALEIVLSLVCFGNLFFGKQEYNSLIFLPFVVLITALYVFGHFKMKQILSQALSVSGKAESAFQKSKAQVYLRVLQHVRRTSLIISCTMVLYIIFAVVYYFSTQTTRINAPGQIESPYIQVVCFGLIAYVTGVVLNSLHASVMRLTNRDSNAVEPSSGGQPGHTQSDAASPHLSNGAASPHLSMSAGTPASSVKVLVL